MISRGGKMISIPLPAKPSFVRTEGSRVTERNGKPACLVWVARGFIPLPSRRKIA